MAVVRADAYRVTVEFDPAEITDAGRKLAREQSRWSAPKLSERAERMVRRIESTWRVAGKAREVGMLLIEASPREFARRQHVEALRALRRYVGGMGGKLGELRALIRAVRDVADYAPVERRKHTEAAKQLRTYLRDLEGKADTP